MAKKIKCPVCGKTEFDYYDDGAVCSVCKWFHDIVQEKYPDEEGGENFMSLNQAKEAYANGEEIT